MINPNDPAQLQDAALAAQAALEEEKRKQSGVTAGDTADIAGNVMVEGIGERVASAAGAVIDSVGTVAGATVDVVGSVISGMLDGI